MEDEFSFLGSQFPDEIKVIDRSIIEFHKELEGESLQILFEIGGDYPNTPPKFLIDANESLKRQLQKEFEKNCQEYPDIPFLFLFFSLFNSIFFFDC